MFKKTGLGQQIAVLQPQPEAIEAEGEAALRALQGQAKPNPQHQTTFPKGTAPKKTTK